jgi:hypothetical protein
VYRSFVGVAHFSVAVVILAVVHPLGGSAADAPKIDLGAARCGGATLAGCTRTRVASLKALSRQLRELAAKRPDSHLSAADVQQITRLDQWLRTTADRADAVAQLGAKAAPQQSQGSSSSDLMQATQQMQEEQMSFNLQYLMLQENMQNDSRQYTAVSNIAKTKQDTLKGIVANMK